MAILELENVTKQFGGLAAVTNLSFALRPRELLGLIGPNGSGKTTVFNLVSGVLPVTFGRVVFEEKDITRLPSHRICHLGLARTFQSPQLFSHMNVLENIMVGFHPVTHSEFLISGLRLPMWRREEEWMIRKAKEILHLVDLDLVDLREMATNLPYGHQRLIEIGRALAANPKVLLLDEPAAGLDDNETKGLGEILRRILTMDISIILVEHNMDLVMDVSGRVIVLNYGQKIAEGTPSEVQKDEKVIQAYLG